MIQNCFMADSDLNKTPTILWKSSMLILLDVDICFSGREGGKNAMALKSAVNVTLVTPRASQGKND